MNDSGYQEVLSKTHICNFVNAGLKIALEIGHILRSNEVMVSIQASVKHIFLVFGIPCLCVCV